VSLTFINPASSVRCAASLAPSRACEEPSPLREFDRRPIDYGVSRSIMRANGVAIAAAQIVSHVSGRGVTSGVNFA
jgi:hypothetical protein